MAWLWAQSERPVFFRLKPEDRARAVVALVGLVILGIVLILLVSWGARVTRWYMNRGPSPRQRTGPSEDDWTSKPLYRDDDEPDQAADERRD